MAPIGALERVLHTERRELRWPPENVLRMLSIDHFDPESAPVIGRDAGLPAVLPARLSADALRARFRAPPVWEPELRAERKGFDRAPAEASVLIALVLHESATTVLLTRRTRHLRDHAGQISFPGGRVEQDDADAADTALREAEEEIGLARRHVEVIGHLPHYTTITQFVVTPVVALVHPGFALRPDPFEVDEVFEVPLDFLMNPAHHERRQVLLQGEQREFFSMPYAAPAAHGAASTYFIWGATAAMLRNFYRFLAA